MLIMNVTIYQHFTNDRKDEEFAVRRRRRKTKDENEDERRKRRRKTKNVDRKKNSRKKKVNFQNKCVSSQKIRMRKEEGATVGASPTFPQLAASSGRTGSFLPWKNPIHWETPINYRKCPTFDAKRETRNAKRETRNAKHETRNTKHETRNTKHETRNAGDFQSSD